MLRSSTIDLMMFAALFLAATMSGFHVQQLGTTSGFLSGLAIDSQDHIYYTTTNGNIFRFAEGRSTLVAHVITDANSNSGLLGLALIDDNTAVVHYTTYGQTYDVLSRIDLTTGAESIIHQFACDIDVPERGSSPEHHGGNPIVGADGSILVGIGDYGGGLIASLPAWNAGKIFRIAPDGEITQIARGLRNPFDLIWDDKRQRVIVADNGPGVGDDILILEEGDNAGWPFTFANQPAADGIAQPAYFWRSTVAPTGTIALNGLNPQLPSGILIGAFVTKSIYWIPDIDARPLPDPIAIVDHETPSIIDIAQSSRNGDIYFATGMAIYKLNTTPRRRAARSGR